DSRAALSKPMAFGLSRIFADGGREKRGHYGRDGALHGPSSGPPLFSRARSLSMVWTPPAPRACVWRFEPCRSQEINFLLREPPRAGVVVQIGPAKMAP